MQTYTGVQGADGNIRLIESDVVDMYEYINSFAESCSIEHILAMCATGDYSLLTRSQGAYIDTTVMPKTFREMLDIVIDGKAKFENLPGEIRSKFGYDFERWFSEAGSDEWLDNMGFVKDNVENVSEEVIENA